MKEFTYKEKLDIYEVLKDMWKSSDTITYRELEKVQVKEWGQVAWKWSTLRNKACKEGWNKEKGINMSNVIRKKRNEILDTVVEIIENNTGEYEELLKGIEKKYRLDFDNVKEQISLAIAEEDSKKLRYIKTAIETIESARSLDLKLSGILDIHEHRKLEMEILKLEILTMEKTDKLLGGE